VATFGYPISRAFTLNMTRHLRCSTQLFQRQVLQQCEGGPVQRLNLLDPDVLPVTQINGSIFPAHEPQVASAAPPPDTPNHAAAVLAHLRRTVPDTVDGLPVRFLAQFMTAMPGTRGDPALVVLANLELWGFPTSRPMRDPNNPAYIYQRFQRGIMHYDHRTRATEAILFGHWFKTILTGENLPPDLEAQVASSPWLRQYCPDTSRWVCRPDELPGTDLTLAFERQ
jgi:hypothetical protein